MKTVASGLHFKIRRNPTRARLVFRIFRSIYWIRGSLDAPRSHFGESADYFRALWGSKILYRTRPNYSSDLWLAQGILYRLVICDRIWDCDKVIISSIKSDILHDTFAANLLIFSWQYKYSRAVS